MTQIPEMRADGGEPRATRPSVAFVTKSYDADRERCELLCRSIRELAPDTSHWVIVDGRHRAAFQSLEGPGTTIVTTEELLGRGLRRIGIPFSGGKNVWVSRGSPPVRGWLVQQLAKLAIAQVADADVLVHADSDIVLIRRFAPDMFFDETGTLRLYRLEDEVDERLPDQVGWHRMAERLLGLEQCPLPLPDYVGGLIPWRRELATSLLETLERRSGEDWFRALARAKDVSEFTLYGRYVEDVVGEGGGHRASAVSYCRCHWGPEALSTEDLAEFVRGAAPSELAVMVSAKVGMQPADYAAVFERRWAEELSA